MILPFIENNFPTPNSLENQKNTLISFDITDPNNTLDISLLDAYIEGIDAYHGTIGFIAPFNGSLSSIQYIPNGSSWGFNLYRIIIDKTNDYSDKVTIEVKYSNIINENWSIFTKMSVPYISNFNTVYFSNLEGIKKVEIANLVGESQSIAQIILSTNTIPPIPDNNINSMTAEIIDGYLYLIFSLKNKILTDLNWGEFRWGETWGEDYIYRGCFTVKNEVELLQFSDGYKIYNAAINDRGILYLINKNTNKIEVYYGADTRSGKDRDPDFIYSTTSIPSIFPGEILCLYITNNSSSELANGTRLYIGTSLGITRIDACDVENPDGYCSGLDYLGKSTTYSIVGGGATYEILGGTSPRVVSVSSNERKTIMFVATDDGYGEAGLSQILLTDNKRMIFMTKENGLIPSNIIRDISGKEV
ncbi:MAG: hypothetical protein WC516_07155 [Patescibacteria group bacterium]|jgi:hypothetical protein